MVAFEKALIELKKGKRVKCLSGINKWLSLTKQGQIKFDTESYGAVCWVPCQSELLAPDWEIENEVHP